MAYKKHNYCREHKRIIECDHGPRYFKNWKKYVVLPKTAGSITRINKSAWALV